MYSAALLELFYHLDHAGELPHGDNTRTAVVGDVQQGDLIHLSVALSQGVIQLARFTCYGGVATLAACEYLCRWLEGKTLAEALTFESQTLLAALQLSSLHVHTADRLQQLLIKIAQR